METVFPHNSAMVGVDSRKTMVPTTKTGSDPSHFFYRLLCTPRRPPADTRRAGGNRQSHLRHLSSSVGYAPYQVPCFLKGYVN